MTRGNPLTLAATLLLGVLVGWRLPVAPPAGFQLSQGGISHARNNTGSPGATSPGCPSLAPQPPCAVATVTVASAPTILPSSARQPIATPVSWPVLRQLAALSFPDANCSSMAIELRELMTLMLEIVRLRIPQWPALTGGLRVGTQSQLATRLAAAADTYGTCWDPGHTLLFNCFITLDNAPLLQETLTQYLFVVGYTHLLVYINGEPGEDTASEAVLAPFVAAGLVTLVHYPGIGVQDAAFQACFELVRAKACHYAGTGDIRAGPDCPPSTPVTYPAVLAGFGRDVFISFFDDDDFVVLRDSVCLGDFLRARAPSIGFFLHWVVAVNNGQMLARNDGAFVSEAFPWQHAVNHGYGKAIHNLSHVIRALDSHLALIRTLDGKGYYTPGMVPGHVAPTAHGALWGADEPAARIWHYNMRSTEEWLLKWARGIASPPAGPFGTKRRYAIGFIRSSLVRAATGDFVNDPSVQPGVAMLKAVLGSSGDNRNNVSTSAVPVRHRPYAGTAHLRRAAAV